MGKFSRPWRRETRSAALALVAFLALLACGASDESGAGGAGGTGGGARRCASHDCTLDCDPADSSTVLTAASAGDPNLFALGDPEPASPDEVGDGLHHVFVGVYHVDHGEPGCGGGDAFIHDAVATSPDGPYAVAPEPLLPLSALDPYDHCGVETPSYLRTDAHTEYLYYCALSEPLVGGIAALRRTDGGAWQKLGIVVPLAPGQSSLCEPDAAFDPTTERTTILFIGDYQVNGTRSVGLFMRSSEQPNAFPVSSQVLLQDYGADASAGIDFYTRPSVSVDPYDGVWRFGFDVNGYVDPPVQWMMQTWAPELLPGVEVWHDHGAMLHDPAHGLHLDQHLEGFGMADANSSAIYPDAERVLFFYVGLVEAPGPSPALPETLVINQQICRRR